MGDNSTNELREFSSVFISYGGPDEDFAISLRDELNEHGVETFIFRDDAAWGEPLHGVMAHAANEFDRVVLICSENSLDRLGVLNELREALNRETREGGTHILIPVTLDDYVFDEWNPNDDAIAQAVRDRVIGDLKGANEDSEILHQQIGRLLSALEQSKNE